eukprot:3189363-Prorocentrum_lima.AAC.1
MTSSLVGSEMCIRDRFGAAMADVEELPALDRRVRKRSISIAWSWSISRPVSYTHLTLPTICSV